MKAIPLDRRRDVRMLQLMAIQFGFNISGELVEQLADQLQAARAWHAEQLANLKAEFDAEVAELRAELDRTKAELEVLRLLNRWPQQRATMQ